MSTPPISVVFDTNSYRTLVEDAKMYKVPTIVKELKELEKQKNIKALGPLIVAMEMLSHLADMPKGRHYKECLRGIRAMALHCSEGNLDSFWKRLVSCYKVIRKLPDPTLEPRIIAQPVLQYAQLFFNATIPDKQNENENIASVVRDFGRCWWYARRFHSRTSNFTNIKNMLTAKELEFANDVENGINAAKADIRSKKPTITDSQLRTDLILSLNSAPTRNLTAIGIIAAVGYHLNSPLLAIPIEIQKRGQALNRVFPLAAGFRCWVNKKVVEDSIDIKSRASQRKRWNWIWDEQVAMLISHSTLNQGEVILVTGDTDLQDCIKAFGFATKVMNLVDYYSFLKSP